MDLELQASMIVWCGGLNNGQDVTIHLVPNGVDQQGTNRGSREPLAVLKVHSTRLKKHSKYFEACLSQRWTQPDANPSAPPFKLELGHGLQVASYIECFSRMYKPLGKDFKDVKSSLELLRVASQIEFHKLVDTICRYLSTLLWSPEDELRIRQFSSCPDFPKGQAEGLVARLQIGEQGNEAYRRKLVLDHIAHSIRIALRQDDSLDVEAIRSAQSLFEDLFSSIRQSQIDSAFENYVVTIVTKEVKEKLESFHEECRKNTATLQFYDETTVLEIDVEGVADFRGKLKGLCWALELLLKAQVAEEVIECLLHLELFFSIINSAYEMDCERPVSKNVALRFCKLAILIFQEVVAGRLLLEIPDRVLLIETWQWINIIHDPDTVTDILMPLGLGQALEAVFFTLPFEQQLKTLQRETFVAHEFISTSSLITLMKKNWPDEEDASLQADLEVEGVASDSMET